MEHYAVYDKKVLQRYEFKKGRSPGCTVCKIKSLLEGSLMIYCIFVADP